MRSITANASITAFGVSFWLFFFLKKKFIYLLMASLGLRCSRIFVASWVLLSSCGTRAPDHADSGGVAHRLSCSTTCGIVVPGPGIEPSSHTLKGRFLTTGPAGKALCTYVIEWQCFVVLAVLFPYNVFVSFWYPDNAGFLK